MSPSAEEAPAPGRPAVATAAPSLVVVTGASSGIGAATARRLAGDPGTRVLMVARREERLRGLAAELGTRTSWVSVDLTDRDAPETVRAAVAALAPARLQLLVNNAGASQRGTFAEGGWANVQQTMALNFDAQLRLTEALLPLLRESAPSAIVNVASTAARVSRAGTGAYSASKAALAAWSDALYAEERSHGVHVALVLPGFIATEGFPAQELTDRPLTRWMVSEPERVADVIAAAARRRQAERFVPRGYALAAALRALAPGLTRRALAGGGAARLTTRTHADGAAQD